MKLVVLVLASLLAIPAARAEEVLNPPSGPVYAESAAPPAQAQPRQHRGQLRRALMLQFDRDGDGRLNGRERMRAARVLAKIQHKLAGRGQRGQQLGGQQMGGQRGIGGLRGQRGMGGQRGELRQDRRELRRLRREQRGMQRDMRGMQHDMRDDLQPDLRDQPDDQGAGAQVDVYVR